MYATVYPMRCQGKLKFLPIIFACLLVAGCGDGKDLLKTYSAQGKALFRGKPMQNALITFHPIDGEAKTRHLLPRGTVGEDGTYTLGTYRIGDGAIPGNYKVTIVWPNKSYSEMISPSQPADQLQGRYVDADASTIQMTIEEKENSLPPIELQ